MTRMTRIQRMLRHEIHCAVLTGNRFPGCRFNSFRDSLGAGCALGDIRPIRVIRIQVWKYRT
jgi:hypothetical protein